MAQTPSTEDVYVGDGAQTVFEVTFPYLQKSEVFVTVNGVITPFTWLAGSTASVQLSAAPVTGAVVKVYRDTLAFTPRHTFAGGVPFLPRYVDENNRQLLYAVQEAINDTAGTAAEALVVANEARDIAEAADAKIDAAIIDSAAALRMDLASSTGASLVRWGDTLLSTRLERDAVDASAYGLHPSKTPAQNMAALKAAYAATPTGSTLWVPPMGGVCVVDTSGGLTGAVTIARRVNVRVDGALKTNYAANEANPSFLFNVTAPRVRFHGSGSIEGNGFDNLDPAGGSDVIYPGLIAVSGDRFDYSGVRMVKVPKIGILLRSCKRAYIHHMEFEGGAADYERSTLPDGSANPAYKGSFLCGVVATGGTGHRVEKVDMTHGEDNGRLAQVVFSGGANGASHRMEIIQCNADRPWEKLAYLYGNWHSVLYNVIEGPTATDAIRFMGSNSTAAWNRINGNMVGMQVLNGRSNSLCYNTLTDIGDVGLSFQTSEAGGDISGSRAIGNTISWDGVTMTRRSAILIYSAHADAYYIQADQNTITGFGVGEETFALRMDAVTYNLYSCTADDNTFTGYESGVRISRGSDCSASRNTFKAGSKVALEFFQGANNLADGNRGDSVGEWFLSLDTSSGNRFTNNHCTNVGNRGVRGMTPQNSAEGNSYTPAPLNGQATAPAGVSTFIIPHSGVVPGRFVQVLPTNFPAAQRWATDGVVAALVATGIQVSNANGNNFGGNETMHYEVIQ